MDYLPQATTFLYSELLEHYMCGAVPLGEASTEPVRFHNDLLDDAQTAVVIPLFSCALLFIVVSASGRTQWALVDFHTRP